MTVRQDRRGATLILTIDREHKRNAIDRVTKEGIDAGLNLLEDDDTLLVGIIAGGASVFSAGTDLKDGTGGPTVRGGEYGIIRRQCTKPLIAAVEGRALGGGFEIVLACDLVVAARSASFSLPEANRGVVAASGALFRALRALPVHVAKELLLTGTLLGAERAYELGLVNRLADPAGALDVALRLADEVCAASPVAIGATLSAINAQWADADALGWEVSAEAVATVTAGEDIKEGIAAFFEKRSPQWPGR